MAQAGPPLSRGFTSPGPTHGMQVLAGQNHLKLTGAMMIATWQRSVEMMKGEPMAGGTLKSVSE
eukprot:5411678-Amphidinium_carterae.1